MCIKVVLAAVQQISRERKTDPQQALFQKNTTDSEQINWTRTHQTTSRGSEDLATGRKVAELCADIEAAHEESMDPVKDTGFPFRNSLQSGGEIPPFILRPPEESGFD